jgi:hypothetical protein
MGRIAVKAFTYFSDCHFHCAGGGSAGHQLFQSRSRYHARAE